MKWIEHRLGDIVKLRSGGTPSKSEPRYWDGDIPWLSSKDLTEARIYDAPLRVTEAGAANGTRLIPKNTVIFVVRGMSLASEFRVSITRTPCTFNQDLKAAECSPKVLPDFLFYSLFMQRDRIKSQAGEASHGTKKLDTYTVENIRVALPDLDTQRRVIEIASAYDDSIENNKRRIALLEEAARMLYREWFERFRFPFHEHAKGGHDFPRGWEQVGLGDVLELRYGKALNREARIDGPFPVYGSSGMVGTHQSALVSGPAIVIGRKGNVGSVYWVSGDFWPIDTVYFVSSEQSDFWLYLTLPGVGFQNTDSGVPGLNRDFAYSRTIIKPADQVRSLFNETVAPMFAQCTILLNANEKLARARDLILPRLMHGEVGV